MRFEARRLTLPSLGNLCFDGKYESGKLPSSQYEPGSRVRSWVDFFGKTAAWRGPRTASETSTIVVTQRCSGTLGCRLLARRSIYRHHLSPGFWDLVRSNPGDCTVIGSSNGPRTSFKFVLHPPLAVIFWSKAYISWQLAHSLRHRRADVRRWISLWERKSCL